MRLYFEFKRTVDDYARSKRLIKKNQNKLFFKQFVTNRVHSLVIPNATYSPWETDAEFMQIYRQVLQNTLVDKFRLYELFSLSSQLGNIRGDFLEVGVWRGGSGALLASVCKRFHKTIYLADTFEGVVNAGVEDTGYSGGEHADTSRLQVEDFLNSNNLRNYKIIQGIFPDEAAVQLNDLTFSFVHIDVDVYESGRRIWEWVSCRIPIGGVVVFDDFGFISCSGITKLVEEIKLSETFIFLHNLNGHAIFIKTA